MTAKRKLGSLGEVRMSDSVCGERVYVTYSINSGKSAVQKSFQNNMAGRAEAKEFYSSMDSASQVLSYLGIGRSKK